jgi:hypothetical protein
MIEKKRADYGTNERHQHGVVKPELTGKGHAVRMRVRDSCELDRLFHASVITPDEWSAGDGFARRLHAARMMGVPVMNFNRVGGGGFISDRQANALIDVTDTITWIDGSVGERARRMVVGVCLSEVRVEEDALDLLRRGLRSLCDMSDAKGAGLSLRIIAQI